MNNFTVCNNRNTWPTLWQKRINSLPERMKSFTPPGKFMMLALLCLIMTGNGVAQRRMLVKTGSSFNNKKRPPPMSLLFFSSFCNDNGKWFHFRSGKFIIHFYLGFWYLYCAVISYYYYYTFFAQLG